MRTVGRRISGRTCWLSRARHNGVAMKHFPLSHKCTWVLLSNTVARYAPTTDKLHCVPMNLKLQQFRSFSFVLFVLVGLSGTVQSAQPSDYDFAFGIGGKVISPRLVPGKADSGFRETPATSAVDSQSRIVVGGQCEITGIFCVVRYLASGALDDAFGVHGLATFTDGTATTPRTYFRGTVSSLVIHTDDKISVVGLCLSGVSGLNDVCAIQFNSDGSTNTAFGNRGIASANPGGSWGRDSVDAMALQSDGKLVVAGLCPQGDEARICLLRFLKSGQPDPGFGQAGVSTTVLGETFFFISLSSVVVQNDGKLLASGFCQPRYSSSFCLFRYAANGEVDRTFGTGGILYATSTDSYGGKKVPAMAVLSDGQILLSGDCGNPGFCVARYDQTGRLDTTFGLDGVVLISDKITSGASMRIAKNGSILFLNRCFTNFSGNLCLIRMTKDGLLDATFGTNGHVDLRIGVIGQNESPVDLQILHDGKYLVVGACDVPGANLTMPDTHFCLARVKGDSVLPGGAETRAMIEYFHEGLNYFFITSRSSDIALLDANREWIRTGSSISVFVNPQPSTLGISRFYFDQVAKNKTRGSHFYTLVQDEKDALAALNPVNAAKPQLPYNEGIDSYAHPPLVEGVGGSCALGTAPVYRLFRGQRYFADNPNHRFTTDVATYQFFLSFNWDGEGVKFCVPL